MKDPVGIFEWRRGFSVRGDAPYGRRNEYRHSGFSIQRSSRMPPWMEILINGIGYAGFIGVAKYHKPSDEGAADR